jgi:hypothetical protein
MHERISKLPLPLLHASLLFIPSVMALRLLGRDGEAAIWAVLCLAWAMAGYGLAMTGERIAVAYHIALALAAGMIPAWLFMGGGWVIRAAEGVIGAALLLWTDRGACRAWQESITSRKLIVSVGLMASMQIVIHMENRFGGGRLYGLTPLVGGVTLFWFVVTLFIVNRLTIRSAAYLDDRRRTPRSLTVNNMLLTALFLGLVMAVAFARRLRDAASWAVAALRNLLIRFLTYLANQQGEGDVGASDRTGSVSQLLKMLGEDARKSPFWELVGKITLYIVIVAVALALAGLAVWGIWKGLCRLWTWLRDRLRRFVDEWQTSRAGYTEEEEDIFSWKQVGEDLRRGMERIARRFRPKARLEDLPDDRARVRMLFRWTLLRMRKRNQFDPARTPCEYRPMLPGGECAGRFIDAYNRARFSNLPVGAADVEAARETYDKL